MRDLVRTPTGKSWTAGRVASLRKQHAIVTACPIEPGAVCVRGDGLISTTEAARRLQVSRSLVNVWLTHGVLIGDQRAAGSDHWVRLTEQDAARLMCAEATICPIVGALGDASNGALTHRIVPARSHQVQ